MEICMDVDVALAEVPVNKLPLIDDGDFKSRETAVAYDAGGMDLVWNFVTSAGAFTQTAVTPTTGGDYDWAHQGDGMYTIEIPASGGASINNDTEGYGWFSGVATGVLPWAGPIITFRAAAVNDALVDGGDTLDVNVTSVAVGVLGKVSEGTLQSGSTSTTAVLAASESFGDDVLKGAIIWIPSTGESKLVGSNVQSTDTVTIVGAWASTPGTVDYEIYAFGGVTQTSSDIAGAVWDALIASYADAGSTGEALSNASSAGDPWSTALPGAYGAGTAGKIVGDNIDAPLSTIDTVVDAIKAVTDNLPDSGALSDLAAILTHTGTTIPATLATIAGYLDTEIAAILVDTGTTIPGLIAALNDPDTATIVAGIMAEAIETGVTFKEAMRAVAAAAAGDTSGMDTGTGVLKAIGNSGTTRITATQDVDGNRSNTLSL